MPVDNDSPPGSWAKEMERMPWGFGQKQPETVEEIIHFLRKKGLEREANILLREFAILKVRR